MAGPRSTRPTAISGATTGTGAWAATRAIPTAMAGRCGRRASRSSTPTALEYAVECRTRRGVFWDNHGGRNYRASRGTLRALALNLHTYQETDQLRKFEQVARAIRELNIDLVCLQEVGEHWNDGAGDWASNAARIINSHLPVPYHLHTDWSHLGFDRYPRRRRHPQPPSVRLHRCGLRVRQPGPVRHPFAQGGDGAGAGALYRAGQRVQRAPELAQRRVLSAVRAPAALGGGETMRPRWPPRWCAATSTSRPAARPIGTSWIRGNTRTNISRSSRPPVFQRVFRARQGDAHAPAGAGRAHRLSVAPYRAAACGRSTPKSCSPRRATGAYPTTRPIWWNSSCGKGTTHGIRRTIRRADRSLPGAALSAPQRVQGAVLPALGAHPLPRGLGRGDERQGGPQGVPRGRHLRAVSGAYRCLRRGLELPPAGHARPLHPSAIAAPGARHLREVFLPRAPPVPVHSVEARVHLHGRPRIPERRRGAAARHRAVGHAQSLPHPRGGCRPAPARRGLHEPPFRVAQPDAEIHEGPGLASVPSQALHPRPDRHDDLAAADGPRAGPAASRSAWIASTTATSSGT